MTSTQDIRVELTKKKKEKPPYEKIGFGIHFTDHMFITDYQPDKGWHRPRIVPYQSLVLDPAAKVLHYGQTVFEGLKAYQTDDNRVLMFRPSLNIERLNRSNVRMSIPELDEELITAALKQLIIIDREWIPQHPGTSLYIRPFVIATEPSLGLSPSTTYQFIIIMSPVGAYYKEGINPVKIYVESEFVRAVRGGVGEAKTAGNYAASLKAQQDAIKKGFTQVLWLDGVKRTDIEEVGSMNVFFKLNGEIHAPALNGSILNGITRKSVIHMLQHWGYKVIERAIGIEEIYEAGKNGTLEEAFGTGTAAVISPIGELHWRNEMLLINQGAMGDVAKRLYETMSGIQNGQLEDPFNWMVEVK
jgi:branched-chain amino acid aminotransferase